ncbi:MAG: hypothetical protein K6E93_09500 [Bacteroidales bacterium]|nr:hypothetical protein [Bacteroidales bacterium]
MGNTAKHFDYIVANEPRISKSPFVDLQKEGKQYILTSEPFYANDGFLHQISSPHWRLGFQCETKNEKLLLGIFGKRPASRMAIQAENDIFTLRMQHYDNGYSWFSLSIEQLLDICTTQSIDLTTDLPLPSNAQFNELPIFASRFYNIAFDRMKFQYSIHVNLITDSDFE